MWYVLQFLFTFCWHKLSWADAAHNPAYSQDATCPKCSRTFRRSK